MLACSSTNMTGLLLVHVAALHDPCRIVSSARKTKLQVANTMAKKVALALSNTRFKKLDSSLRSDSIAEVGAFV